jgi:hypothetical protein
MWGLPTHAREAPAQSGQWRAHALLPYAKYQHSFLPTAALTLSQELL